MAFSYFSFSPVIFLSFCLSVLSVCLSAFHIVNFPQSWHTHALQQLQMIISSYPIIFITSKTFKHMTWGVRNFTADGPSLQSMIVKFVRQYGKKGQPPNEVFWTSALPALDTKIHGLHSALLLLKIISSYESHIFFPRFNSRVWDNWQQSLHRHLLSLHSVSVQTWISHV